MIRLKKLRKKLWTKVRWPTSIVELGRVLTFMSLLVWDFAALLICILFYWGKIIMRKFVWSTCAASLWMCLFMLVCVCLLWMCEYLCNSYVINFIQVRVKLFWIRSSSISTHFDGAGSFWAVCCGTLFLFSDVQNLIFFICILFLQISPQAHVLSYCLWIGVLWSLKLY